MDSKLTMVWPIASILNATTLNFDLDKNYKHTNLYNTGAYDLIFILPTSIFSIRNATDLTSDPKI
jgi:hypothetical protein